MEYYREIIRFFYNNLQIKSIRSFCVVDKEKEILK
jgi:hypothetical protein